MRIWSKIKGNNMLCRRELLKQICLVVDMKWNLQKYIVLSKKSSGTFKLNFTFSLSSAISVKGWSYGSGGNCYSKELRRKYQSLCNKFGCHVNSYPVAYFKLPTTPPPKKKRELTLSFKDMLRSFLTWILLTSKQISYMIIHFIFYFLMEY